MMAPAFSSMSLFLISSRISSTALLMKVASSFLFALRPRMRSCRVRSHIEIEDRSRRFRQLTYKAWNCGGKEWNDHVPFDHWSSSSAASIPTSTSSRFGPHLSSVVQVGEYQDLCRGTRKG